MKIFTNITREYLGGITATNNSLLSFLASKKQKIIGLEYDTVRCMKGPFVLEGLDQNFFEHYILNISDLPFEKSPDNLGELRKYYRPAIKEIKNLIRTASPDVVLINGTNYFSWIVATAAKESGIPAVLRYHGISSKENSHLPGKMKRRFLKMERSFLRMAEAFIFPSELCRRTVENEVFGRKIDEAYVIPNPVSVPGYIRKPAKRKIAMVARWSWIKNYGAFFRLHEALRKENWKHEASIISDAGEDKIPKTITCLKPTDPEKLHRFYRSQGLIISPSHFETFGNVPMEAICSGVPALVSDKMGCAEILMASGLEEMVMDFSDMRKVTSRVKELCGKGISPGRIEKLKKILDPGIINKKILRILKDHIE